MTVNAIHRGIHIMASAEADTFDEARRLAYTLSRVLYANLWREFVYVAESAEFDAVYLASRAPCCWWPKYEGDRFLDWEVSDSAAER